MRLDCPEIHYPVFWIDTDEALASICTDLMNKSLLALDTEFDRFRRKYGINLELVQLFDGEHVYLIRILSLRDLSPLKTLIENQRIIKVLYSGSEDIQVFKVNNIVPKSVYDLQPASQLSGFTAVSLAGLLEEVVHCQFDKSKQTSDWSKLQLDREQVVYAANDVIYLLELYQRIIEGAIQCKTTSFIEEENRLLEAVVVSETIPRLKQQQREMFNRHEQALLLALMHVRDGLGKTLNKPPHFVLADKQLESLLAYRDRPLRLDDLKTYSVFFKRSDALLHTAHQGITSVLAMPWPPPKPIVSRETSPRLMKVSVDNEKVDVFLLEYQTWLGQQYPTTVVQYLCSGIKRFLREYLSEAQGYNFPSYKRTLLFNYVKETNIDLKTALI